MEAYIKGLNNNRIVVNPRDSRMAFVHAFSRDMVELQYPEQLLFEYSHRSTLTARQLKEIGHILPLDNIHMLAEGITVLDTRVLKGYNKDYRTVIIYKDLVSGVKDLDVIFVQVNDFSLFFLRERGFTDSQIIEMFYKWGVLNL